jgi:hypothetical protein
MLPQLQQRHARQEALQAAPQAAAPMPFDIETVSGEGGHIERTLELSASRAYDCALEILGAHKLTGNFHVNLEIVLKDIGALDKVTFEIEPSSQLFYATDCRHVLFRPRGNVHMRQFNDIMRSLRRRIGFDATSPWWVRLFQ